MLQVINTLYVLSNTSFAKQIAMYVIMLCQIYLTVFCVRNSQYYFV